MAQILIQDYQVKHNFFAKKLSYSFNDNAQDRCDIPYLLLDENDNVLDNGITSMLNNDYINWDNSNEAAESFLLKKIDAKKRIS